MPTVSVIVPTFNRAGVLPRALDSALAQTGVGFEILVVDDGSTDDTGDVLAGHAGRVETLAQEHGGVARARNRALAHARGDYVAFLDSDDFWLPGKLVRQAAWLEANREIALLCSDYRVFEDGPGGRPHFVAERRHRGPCDFATLFRRNFVGTSTVVARRLRIEEAGGFDPSWTHGSDYDLWLRLARHHPVARLSETLAAWRRSAESLTGLDVERDVRTWHAVTEAWIKRDPEVLAAAGMSRAEHAAELPRRLGWIREQASAG